MNLSKWAIASMIFGACCIALYFVNRAQVKAGKPSLLDRLKKAKESVLPATTGSNTTVTMAPVSGGSLPSGLQALATTTGNNTNPAQSVVTIAADNGNTGIVPPWLVNTGSSSSTLPAPVTGTSLSGTLSSGNGGVVLSNGGVSSDGGSAVFSMAPASSGGGSSFTAFQMG